MALALMLILEGVLPFLAPNLWRDTFRRITLMSDGQIRFVGLSSMLVGLLLLLWGRGVAWSGFSPSPWKVFCLLRVRGLKFFGGWYFGVFCLRKVMRVCVEL